MIKQLWTPIILFALLGALLCSCKTEVREGDKNWNTAVEPFRKTMDMGGYTLSFIDMGSGEPVVLIHGFADSTYSWRENAFSLMEDGNRLIIVDLPGHGLSGFPPEPYAYSVENQAKAVMTLVDNLGLKDFSLAGHCMGGGVALYIAGKYPARVRRLALIDPVAYKPPVIQLLRLPGMEYLAANYGGPFAVRMGLEDSFYDSDNVNDTMVNEYSRPLSRPGYWKVLIKTEKDFYSPEFYATAGSLRRILRPTLIIWGREDTWVTQEQGRELHDDIYNSTLHILDKCGHNPHQECHRSVTPLLAEFLREAQPRVDQFLIQPGIGIGEITLGITRDEVRKIAGKAIMSTKNGEQFEGFIVRYLDGRVSEVLATASSYRTKEGINTYKPVERFLAAYPNAKITCYETRSGGRVSNGILYDAQAQGIAYDWNVFVGKRREVTVTINIHAPGVPVKVYGTAVSCQSATPAGK